jgi:hypothetical protein
MRLLATHGVLLAGNRKIKRGAQAGLGKLLAALLFDLSRESDEIGFADADFGPP